MRGVWCFWMKTMQSPPSSIKGRGAGSRTWNGGVGSFHGNVCIMGHFLCSMVVHGSVCCLRLFCVCIFLCRWGVGVGVGSEMSVAYAFNSCQFLAQWSQFHFVELRCGVLASLLSFSCPRCVLQHQQGMDLLLWVDFPHLPFGAFESLDHSSQRRTRLTSYCGFVLCCDFFWHFPSPSVV